MLNKLHKYNQIQHKVKTIIKIIINNDQQGLPNKPLAGSHFTNFIYICLLKRLKKRKKKEGIKREERVKKKCHPQCYDTKQHCFKSLFKWDRQMTEHVVFVSVSTDASIYEHRNTPVHSNCSLKNYRKYSM